MCLMPEGAAHLSTEATATVPGSEELLISPETSAEPGQLPTPHRDQSEPLPRPIAVPTCPPPQLPGYDHDVSQWNCSQQQRIWMKTELESMGLWPGSIPVRNPMKMVSLWRLPPQPELIDSISDLPSPKYFQLHPFFIWKPENNNLMGRMRNNDTLPCMGGCARPQVASAGVGRPRVVVGITGQYYLLSSRLCCKVCKKKWYADNPLWLDKLPKRYTNLLPAILTYKKAICKSVMDELRRTGNSPSDMTKQVMEVMHLKFERAHLAHLLSCQNVMDGEAGQYDQRTITQFLRQETKPAPFGEYSDSDGWNGIIVSSHYLADCLLHEYQHQESAINTLLQGTFGQAFRSDHTRKIARKVTFSSGTMSSYAVMNENWMILSWVMVQSETEKSLKPMYEGLARRYSTAGIEKAQYHWVDRDCCAAFKVAESYAGEHLNWDSWQTTDAIVAQATSGNLLNTCASRSHFSANLSIKLDLFHCMRRFLRECVTEHHSLYSSFAQFLSAAFSVVDQEDLQRLKDAYAFCGIQPAIPTKPHIREHCRTRITQPEELIKRVEGVLQQFHLASDPNGAPLFKPSMLKLWRIQRVHILRGCLSDPVVEGGILYRHGGSLQLNHVQGEGARVPIWIPIRGTSQQEGYHFHQAQWVTGTRVSPELFQAQGMTGVARWNYQRLVDLKQPGVHLPAVFDPALMAQLNAVSERVLGHMKYPAFHLSSRDTGEKFGLQYVEPGCRPVPVDWDKHRTKTDSAPALSPPPQSSAPTAQSSSSSMAPLKLFQFPPRPAADSAVKPDVTPGPQTDPETCRPSLPLLSSPTAARTGPVKTGGRVFVLDHKRWPAPMKAAIDNLLNEHRGMKDMLKLVDQGYAALVHNSCTDPNSMLHPTTKHHILQYVKHLCKLLNTSSSLNTSPEKLQERQELWHSLTKGSETTRVPVVTMPVAVVNPPPPGQTLTKASIEEIVQNILDKQQQHQQQQQQPVHKKKQTKTCLSCGQPKSRYENDGSSIHFFYQQGPVRYFYCSTKVFKAYGAEGLTNPKMPFKDFAGTKFFQQELYSTKKRVEERGQQKRKRTESQHTESRDTESQHTGPRCRFCRMGLKQGPNSPHIHTGFPGVTGKYVYCPAKVFSLYKDQGMEKEMTWREFQVSAFYETEKNRWAVEKRK
ncbi:uncharacterized protein LOC117751652 isoform X1 [Cyclopterus lumpus]|uniref:uncharacterized protein LOC117751652 isoform X1 n=1 Tax=Cyclopterus lumpus TaxID=8103 RepID=UPI001486838F|nr:uncharacterized protein LOC117751652 isoform X1 [Cyclopterus lumpus]XP_034419484.1 uncharacterized protein LOC117751652 isoform X1 [Cyclopterus lumpus]